MLVRFLAPILLFLGTVTVSAQTPAKPFKVKWYGQSFFVIETPTGKKIATDPHQIPAFGRPIVSADIVTISHDHNDHNVMEAIENRKSARVFNGLKENKGRTDWVRHDEKVGSIRIRSLPSFHDSDNGMTRGKNSIFVIEADGLTFCHMGDLGHPISDDLVKLIGKIDVLILPIGGTYTINGEQAKKIVEQLKPRLHVIPMHYGVPNYDDLNGPDEFLDGQKLKVTRTLATNEMSIAPDAKPEAPTVVLLGTAPVEIKKK